jgi:hypothetical protein
MEDFAVVEFIIGIIVGFVGSFIALKRSLSKSGAGNLKMCKTCDYMVACNRSEKEAEVGNG